jgi:isopentenyl phosphate kinase
LCDWSIYLTVLHLIEQVIELLHDMTIRVITKFPNSEQSYKGKFKTHMYMQNLNQIQNKIRN